MLSSAYDYYTIVIRTHIIAAVNGEEHGTEP